MCNKLIISCAYFITSNWLLLTVRRTSSQKHSIDWFRKYMRLPVNCLNMMYSNIYLFKINKHIIKFNTKETPSRAFIHHLKIKSHFVYVCAFCYIEHIYIRWNKILFCQKWNSKQIFLTSFCFVRMPKKVETRNTNLK